MRPGHIAGPLVLIAAGLLFLLNNLGWGIPIGYLIRTYWPLILVAVGVAQIAGAAVGKGNLSGGVVVLTLGVLFSLQRIWGISFRDTWPVMLIAVGAVGLLRAVLGPVAFSGRAMRGARR